MSLTINWTHEMVDVGLKLWHEGKSATEVSSALSHQFQCKISRNSWIGKVHRLVAQGKIVRRGGSNPVVRDSKLPSGKERKVRLPAVKPVVKLEGSPPSSTNVLKWKQPEKPISKAGLVTIDRATGCLYAVTNTSKGVHLFCNKATHGESSYCQEHHALCYVKPGNFVKKNWRIVR